MQNDPSDSSLNARQGRDEIPTPVSTRWREFRVRVLPTLIIAGCLVGVWQLWTDMPSATALRGIGEGSVSILASPQDGFLDFVAVPERGFAKAGDDLVTITPYDPAARMGLIQSQMQLSRMALEPSISDRNAVNYEQLRLESLRLRRELSMAKANLERAQKTLIRYEAMIKDRLITQDLFDQTVRDRDLNQSLVSELTKNISEVEYRLDQLKPFAQSEHSGGNPAVAEMLPRFEAQLEAAQTNLNPVTLTAPIGGEVHYIRNSREFVRAGEQLLTINSDKADRVIAYVKQPMTFEPELGMPMRVTTRSRKRIMFDTYIAQIGARVEVITNALAYIAPGAIVDSGLPLILPVPDNVQVRPGEIVDVELIRGESKPLEAGKPTAAAR